MVNEILKFLEVYSKTMQAQNKYISDNTWNAYKLISSLSTELDELVDEVRQLKEELKKELKKNEQTRKS